MSKIQHDECVLYWAHTKDQTCVGSQGYVGISTDFNARVASHLSSSSNKNCKQFNTRFYKAIRKYGCDIVFEILYQGSSTNCLIFENMLRPVINIGWNHAIGGSKTMLGFKHSYETRLKQSILHRGKKVSDSTRQKISIASKSRVVPKEVIDLLVASRRNLKPWETGKRTDTSLYLWSIADEIYLSFLQGSTRIELENALYLRKNSLAVLSNHIKNGWIPFDDDRWLSFKSKYTVDRDTFPVNNKRYKFFVSNKNYGSNLTAWVMCDDIYSYWKSNNCGKRKLSKIFSVLNPNVSECMIKKFRAGWIPEHDKDWLDFRNKYNKENVS